ncbi:hypothetical protein NQF87_07715 [Bombella sp. TMW 2.2559]|uniref:AAA domain-containing protein n=1 Tax=Bombella dulcis TaxID=2967339 RepID=A0ABT3WCP9_9PROT|nr:hypothetical protein [Bombella dulcis]MCX5616855.1 hypothetical protein [Bombella dulcis]
MIENIKLKFGSGQNTPSLKINPQNITIIVGPNNSGKSKLLREIYIELMKDGIENSFDDEYSSPLHENEPDEKYNENLLLEEIIFKKKMKKP